MLYIHCNFEEFTVVSLQAAEKRLRKYSRKTI